MTLGHLSLLLFPCSPLEQNCGRVCPCCPSFLSSDDSEPHSNHVVGCTSPRASSAVLTSYVHLANPRAVSPSSCSHREHRLSWWITPSSLKLVLYLASGMLKRGFSPWLSPYAFILLCRTPYIFFFLSTWGCHGDPSWTPFWTRCSLGTWWPHLFSWSKYYLYAYCSQISMSSILFGQKHQKTKDWQYTLLQGCGKAGPFTRY